MLFKAFEGFAKTGGCRKLSLEVIDTNPRAQKLYERLGFVTKKRSTLWPANRIFGWPFKETILMEKIIKDKGVQNRPGA